jgi:hypothetical protein
MDVSLPPGPSYAHSSSIIKIVSFTKVHAVVILAFAGLPQMGYASGT